MSLTKQTTNSSENTIGEIVAGDYRTANGIF
jgi:hypothetical protein